MTLANVLGRLEANEARSISLSNEYGQDALRLSEKQTENQLSSLTEFSTTLAEHLVWNKEREIEEAKESGRIKMIERDLEKIEEDGSPDISDEELDEYFKSKEFLKLNKTAFDTSALLFQQQGGSYQDGEALSKMSGWELYGAVIQKGQSAGDVYQAWMEGEMATDDKTKISYRGRDFTPATAQDLDEKAVAMTALRRRFLREQGLLGIDRKVLADKEVGFYDKIIPAHNQIMAQFQRDDAIRKSFEKEEDAVRVFRANKNIGELISALSPLRNANNQLVGHKGAWEKAEKLIKELMDVNLFNGQDLERIGNQVIMVDGKPKIFKDHWKLRYEKLDDYWTEAEKKHLNLSETEKENKFKKAEAIVLADIEQMSDEDLTDTFLLEQKYDLESRHIGFQSDKLDKYIKNASPDAITLKRQKLEARKLLKHGLLTEEKLYDEFDPRVIKEFKDLAKKISERKDKTKQYLGYIEDMVKRSGKLNAFGMSHESVGQMIDIQKKDYLEKYAEAVLAGSEQPEIDAWNFINTRWGDEGKQFKDGRGFYKIPYETDAETTTKNQATILSETARQNKLLKEHGIEAIAIEDAFITKSALEKNLKTFGTPGWKPPGAVKKLKKRFPEKSELEIIQALSAAHDIKLDIPDSPALKIIQDNATTQQKAIINHGGDKGSSRVLGTVSKKKGSDNVEFVPNGEGENVLQVSNDSGITFSEAAAGYEFLLANNLTAFKLGAEKEDLELGGTGIKWDRLGQAITRLITSIDTSTLDNTDVLAERLRTSVANNEESITEGITNILEALQTTDTTDVLASQTRKLTSEENLQFLAEVLIDAAGQQTDTTEIISGQMTEALNELVDQVLGPDIPLTEEEQKDLALLTFKYSGNPVYLNKTLRIN